jgi:hypothetical protein
MLVLGGLILRGRRATLPTGAELRRRRLGTHLTDAMERSPVTRETRTAEPARAIERPSARLQALWDQRIKPAIEAERKRKALHPSGWLCVGVSDGLASGWLCALAPTGPAVDYFDERTGLWCAAPGWLAARAHAVFAGST